MQPDELWIQRARKGDADAFDSLLMPYETRIYAICLRMMGNREDAMDCAQETMLRVFRSLTDYRGQSAFPTWIYRIATNICLDTLRRRKVRSTSSLDAMLEDGFTPADTAPMPEQTQEVQERRAILERGIASLPDDMRAALVLRDIQGLSYEEVSSILQINMNTVKSRINRAREKLRTLLLQTPELFDRSCVYGYKRRDNV
ncbi:MAG: sigma-70 family RNA polymerase sigma factor [Clostridia bacterium]